MLTMNPAAAVGIFFGVMVVCLSFLAYRIWTGQHGNDVSSHVFTYEEENDEDDTKLRIEKRREFLNKILLVKKCLTGATTSESIHDIPDIASVTEDGDDGSHMEDSDGSSSHFDVEEQIPNRCFEINDIAKDPDAYIKEGEMCSICLGDFEDGDDICLPLNKNCSHVFHKDCIMEWLIKHDECPCCRSYYIRSTQQDVMEEV